MLSILFFSVTDINECQEDPGLCSQFCSNTDGSYICHCERGYELGSDENTCVDIDECAVHNGGCEQICDNTNGSYYCSCNYGYELSSNRSHCDSKIFRIWLTLFSFTERDINECLEETDGCAQKCEDIVGGYSCSCDDGYKLENDNHTCTDIDECALDNGGCEQYCNNTIGSYSCSCFEGYIILSNNHECEGIKRVFA